MGLIVMRYRDHPMPEQQEGNIHNEETLTWYIVILPHGSGSFGYRDADNPSLPIREHAGEINTLIHSHSTLQSHPRAFYWLNSMDSQSSRETTMIVPQSPEARAG